ncbi:MAG: hypothetical protein K2Q03_03615 [Sphingobacteriaceae bacterium]|nr:hypothetical protein [Sphingobacteriaceae bacterium]
MKTVKLAHVKEMKIERLIGELLVCAVLKCDEQDYNKIFFETGCFYAEQNGLDVHSITYWLWYRNKYVEENEKFLNRYLLVSIDKNEAMTLYLYEKFDQ